MIVDCTVPNCAHDDDTCITEAELNMSFEEFFDKAAADEGFPQSVADEYKRAFATALDIPTPPDTERREPK